MRVITCEDIKTSKGWSVLSFLPNSPKKIFLLQAQSSLWPAKNPGNAWAAKRIHGGEWSLLVMAKDHLRSPEHRPGLSTWLAWSQSGSWGGLTCSVSVIWQVLVGSGAGCGWRTAQNTKISQSVFPVSDASSVNLMMPLGHKLVLCLEKVRGTWGFLLHSSNEKDTFFFLFWKNLQGDFRGS